MARPKERTAGQNSPNPARVPAVNWLAEKRPVLVFGLSFALLIALLYGLLAIPAIDQALYFYLKANAWCAGAMLNLLGQHTQVSDVTIRSTRFVMAIRRGCDAVEPIWLYSAAVLCFPSGWKKKLVGILMGAVILQALNFVRIVSLYWIGIYLPAFFNSAHVELWPMAFIAVAIALFVLWKGWPEPVKSDVAL